MARLPELLLAGPEYELSRPVTKEAVGIRYDLCALGSVDDASFCGTDAEEWLPESNPRRGGLSAESKHSSVSAR